MRKLILGLVVLLGLALLVDFGAAAWSEYRVSRALREGGGADAVEPILRRAVGAKPTGHRLEEGVFTEARAMFQIGG